MNKGPKRLTEDGDELAAALKATQSQLPSGERLAELGARLARAGLPLEQPLRAEPAALKLPSEAASGLAKAKLFGPGTLMVMVASISGVAVIAAAVALKAPDVPQMPASARGLAVPSTAAEPAPVVTASAASGSRSAATEASSAAAPRETPSALGTAPPDAPPPPETATANPPPPAYRPEAATTASGKTSATNESPVEPRPTGTGRPRATSATASSAPALAESTVVDSEVELLKKARSALGGDPIQAFALTERCRAQYPNGAFAQEREYIAISALVRLGRTEEARSRVSLFRIHYKNSAYLPRLLHMLGEE